jgi:hypothetical protein
MTVAVCDPRLFIAIAAYGAGVNRYGDRRVRESVAPVEGRPDLVAETWANVLYRENIRQVSIRYPEHALEALPGPGERPKMIRMPEGTVAAPPVTDLLTILSLCDELEYQCGITPDWEDTAACDLMEEIRLAASQEYFETHGGEGEE